MRKRTPKDKRRRRRVAPGVYKDGYGYLAQVRVGSGDHACQRAKRFPLDTSLQTIREWIDRTRADLRHEASRQRGRVTAGTLEADAPRYLEQVAQLVSYKTRICEVAAWIKLYGRLRRSQITAAHVRKARATWASAKYAPKTINNRCQTLRHLYHVLDGEDAPTPVDRLRHLPVPESVKILVPPDTFRKVASKITDPKVKARFMVIASTGVRPSELKRAQPADIDLERRAWLVRTGKGGKVRLLYLNEDMLVAVRAFLAADAFGPFDGSAYARALHAAGWPTDVRPYMARHSTAIAAGEAGVDLVDVADLLGHVDVTTTRKYYSPVLLSRLKRASEALAGRFGKWEALEDEAPDLEGLPASSQVH